MSALHQAVNDESAYWQRCFLAASALFVKIRKIAGSEQDPMSVIVEKVDHVSNGSPVKSGAHSMLPDLSRDEKQALLEFHNEIPLWHFAVSVFFVFFSPILVMLYPSIVTMIVCVLLNVHTFNRFAQIVHGSDHAGLFTDKRWDSIIGHVSSAFLGYTRDGHQATHNAHHVFLNTERDGDRMWCEPEAPVSSVFRGWLRDIFLVSAFYRFFQYSSGVKDERPSAPSSASNVPKKKNGILTRFFRREVFVALAPAIPVQIAIMLTYAMTGGIQYYFFLYVLPILTIYPAQVRLRAQSEHSFPPGEDSINPKFDRRVTRSTKGSWLLRFVMAPIYLDYHYEHHALPNMPYYNAPKMRRILEQKGFSIPYGPGYVTFLWQKWRAEHRHMRPSKT